MDLRIQGAGGGMMERNDESKMHRRTFLKATGAAGALAGGAGLGFFGYGAGRDPGSYTGWTLHEGAHQSFERKKWEVDQPHYERTGPTSRPDARTDVIFYRRPTLMRLRRKEVKADDLEEPYRAFYSKNPDVLELDLLFMNDVLPKQRKDMEEFGKQFLLAEAWSSAMGAVYPAPIDEPPEISDFPRRRTEPLKMKSPEKTTRLVKKIAHALGSTLVGIARLNRSWVYLYPMRGRGFEPDKPLEVPKHWEFAIVVGTPMSWDPLYSNPNYGTSNDAYSRSRIIAFRVADFIKRLGYPARPHTPGASYDLMVPPIMVDAGLGEQGRHSVVITPEVGCNFRPAVVTTNIPLVPDKPIDFGVQDFCKTCMICAENCPSGAITTKGKVEIRGYTRYPLNSAKCHNFWHSTLGSMGCRLCIAVCPYTRKANWLHRTALKASMHDPTGLVDNVLTGLQKKFYPGPDPQKYYIPSLGGENASYREPPWWLRTEDFIEI
jgi:reductive dehalogenase